SRRWIRPRIRFQGAEAAALSLRLCCWWDELREWTEIETARSEERAVVCWLPGVLPGVSALGVGPALVGAGAVSSGANHHALIQLCNDVVLIAGVEELDAGSLGGI